jgi:septal ring factor EnvC (AmiA/AmiB activator)
MTRTLWLTLLALALAAPAAAQDIRGLEICTAEKAMERRTGCLQSNIEFLQQALVKQARETQAKIDAANKDAAAQKAGIVALKTALQKLQQEVADLKKPKPEKK